MSRDQPNPAGDESPTLHTHEGQHTSTQLKPGQMMLKITPSRSNLPYHQHTEDGMQPLASYPNSKSIRPSSEICTLQACDFVTCLDVRSYSTRPTSEESIGALPVLASTDDRIPHRHSLMNVRRPLKPWRHNTRRPHVTSQINGRWTGGICFSDPPCLPLWLT